MVPVDIPPIQRGFSNRFKAKKEIHGMFWSGLGLLGSMVIGSLVYTLQKSKIPKIVIFEGSYLFQTIILGSQPLVFGGVVIIHLQLGVYWG